MNKGYKANSWVPDKSIGLMNLVLLIIWYIFWNITNTPMVNKLVRLNSIIKVFYRVSGYKMQYIFCKISICTQLFHYQFFSPKDTIWKLFKMMILFNFLEILVIKTNCQCLFHKSDKVTKCECTDSSFACKINSGLSKWPFCWNLLLS